MIDFRYHLVSIVSVFLALAVGIVIGATSLKGEVAGTLEGQVTQLRQEKKGLRGQLDSANEGNRRQDQYAGDIAPRALANELHGRTVALVVLPDTPAAFIRDTRASLKQAGGTVTTTAELSTDWVTGDGDQRDKTLRAAGREQGVDVDSVPMNRLGGLVLAESLTVKPGVSDAQRKKQPGRAVLVDEGLMEVDPVPARRADSIVVLWPGVEKSTRGWVNLVTATGLAGRPAVGVSAAPYDPGTSTADAMITTLRDSAEVTGTMSTVDHGERAVGQAALVLALRDEFDGRAGHYGLDEDAVAVAPKLKQLEQEPEE